MSDSTIINKDITKGSFFSNKLKTVIRTQKNDELAVLAMNEVINQRYKVIGLISVNSGEADIYKVTDLTARDEMPLVLKIYRRRDAVKQEILDLLATLDSPYIASLLDTGEFSGYNYTVMPFYSRGSLASYIEKGEIFKVSDVRTMILPSVMEGLKVIHDAGIIHKDLKPGNMMVSDDGSHIVLIDFGISSVTEGNTMVVTHTGKSPFYSAPETVTGLYWTGSDYYSLGISLYEIVTGVTPYQNAGIEDIARFAQAQKIPYPDDFDADLKDLIDGLTYKDISFRNDLQNPNRRWGYEEIKKWLNGIRQPVPGTTGIKTSEKTDVPYIFKGQKYFSDMDYAKALLESWDDGKKELFRGFMFKQFEFKGNTRAAEIARAAEESFFSRHVDDDVLFLETVYKFSPGIRDVYWKNHHFADLKDFASRVLDEMYRTGAPDEHEMYGTGGTGVDEKDAQDEEKPHELAGILARMNLQEVLQLLAMNQENPDEILSIIREAQSEDFFDQDTFAERFCRSLTGRDDFSVDGEYFSSLADFNAFLEKLHKDDLYGYVNYCREHVAELEQLSIKFISSKNAEFTKNLPFLLSDSEKDSRSFIRFGDYVFWSAEEAVKYCSILKDKVKEQQITVNICNAEVKELYEKYVAGRCKLEKAKEVLNERREAILRFGSEYSESLTKSSFKWRDNLRKAQGVAAVVSMLRRETEDNEDKEGSISIGSSLFFGRYMQINSSLKTPVEWLVLDVIGNRALLLSKYCLDAQPFDAKGANGLRWLGSHINTWLNSYFIQEAFSEKEKEKILPYSEFINYKLFLLSKEQFDNYVDTGRLRLIAAEPTDYAVSKGAVLIEHNNGAVSGDTTDKMCRWWLRTLTFSNSMPVAYSVGNSKQVSEEFIFNERMGVRVAMWIDITR